MYEQPNLTVRKLLMYETGTYNDQVLRPYESNLDLGTLDRFMHYTNDGSILTPSAMGNIAGNILAPAAQAVSAVTIANGWDIPRLSFMMEVERNVMGNVQVEILTGYTDHVGVANGFIDPNMVLYFNSTMVMQTVQSMGATGRQNVTTMRDPQHILSEDGIQSSMPYHGVAGMAPNPAHLANTPISIRPEDVVSRIASEPMLSYNEDVVDPRITFANGVKKSLRSNANASSYLSRTMTAFKGAADAAVVCNDNHAAIMNQTIGTLREGLVEDDMYLKEFVQHEGIHRHGAIAWSELLAYNPHLDAVTTVVVHNRNKPIPVHQRGSTENWNGATAETVCATVLAHAVPAEMLSVMITNLKFRMTNMTLDGQDAVVVEWVESFADGLDIRPYVDRFLYKLKSEILPGITHNGMTPYQITVSVDVIGETYIAISLNGQPTVDYVVPSFCDALLAPIRGTSAASIDRLTHDFNSICENVLSTANAGAI